MRHFFIPNSETFKKHQIITGNDANHIKHVLRLKPGNKIVLFDGTGYKYKAVIVKFIKNNVSVTIINKFLSLTESPIQITVAQAFLKEKKMNILIRQLTELGISKWFPFIASRSVSKPDSNRLSGRLRRWQKIASESVKQCRRGCIPEIGPLQTFKEVIHLGLQYDFKIVFYENESKPIETSSISSVKSLDKMLLVFGPEGGFSLSEIEQAKSAAFTTASLGPRILKAETAPVAACTIIQYLFGDMGAKTS